MNLGVRLILLLIALLAPAVQALSAPMEYRYWDWGKTAKRDDYQIAVLRLALEKTVPSHGPYSIVRVVESYSTKRLRREVFNGDRINVHVGPWRRQDRANPYDRNIQIEISIIGGMLGYRNLIVRREDLAKFHGIDEAADLKRLTAGQGRDWIDVTLYRNHGYLVDDRANLSSLLAMLVNKRFDYLPMSVIEVESFLANEPDLARDLAVVPGMLIQYPLPAIFYVSASKPELARRLEKGLTMMRKDGSLAQFMERSFQRELQKLNSETTREYFLDNPSLPKHMQTPRTVFRTRPVLAKP